jgi:hypothetical protein
MAVLKVLASISLIAFAIAAQPALAANDGQSNNPAPGIGSPDTTSPNGTMPRAHRAKLTPEQRAARRARREARHQQRLQGQGPSPSGSAPN